MEIKTIKAPMTDSEKKLLDIISNRDYTLEDVLNDLDFDFDDIRSLIRSSVAEILKEKPDIYAVKVCDLEISFQPEITVTTEETQTKTADEEFSGLSL